VPVIYAGKDFRQSNVLSQKRKSEYVMDGESGEDGPG